MSYFETSFYVLMSTHLGIDFYMSHLLTIMFLKASYKVYFGKFMKYFIFAQVLKLNYAYMLN